MKKLLLAASCFTAVLHASPEQELGMLMQSLDGLMGTLIAQAIKSNDKDLKALASKVDSLQKQLDTKLKQQKKTSNDTAAPVDVQSTVNELGKSMNELITRGANSSDANIKKAAQSIRDTQKRIDAVYGKLQSQRSQQSAQPAQQGGRQVRKIR